MTIINLRRSGSRSSEIENNTNDCESQHYQLKVTESTLRE